LITVGVLSGRMWSRLMRDSLSRATARALTYSIDMKDLSGDAIHIAQRLPQPWLPPTWLEDRIVQQLVPRIASITPKSWCVELRAVQPRGWMPRWRHSTSVAYDLSLATERV